MYLMRLDDACEHWDKEKWHRIHDILHKYQVNPIVAIIPHVEDKKLLDYSLDNDFFVTIKEWIDEGWTPALHGYNHLLLPSDGGLNPVNRRSEFVGLSYEQQREKISKGYESLTNAGIYPKVFVAPAHTFDSNTLEAIRETTNISIISDTIANDVYFENGFYFIPQQSGSVRDISFKIVSFCYHPNSMSDKSFLELVDFLDKHSKEFLKFDEIELKKRKKSLFDKLLSSAYFLKRKIAH